MTPKVLRSVSLLSILAVAAISNAGSYSFTLGEYNDLSQSYTITPVGTFDLSSLAGQTITGAKISGTFGNSSVPNSSGVDVTLDGILVAQNTPADPGYYNTTAWSHTLTLAELSVLLDGSATLSAQQTSLTFVRLGQTTLTVEASPVPGPAAALPFALLALKRRKRA